MLEIKVKKQLGQLAFEARLDIPSQGITGIFGLSGSGKSSLINFVSGLLKPDEGRICLNERTLVDTQTGVNLAPHKRHIGYVFQDARLFPHYNVKGNLCYGIKRGHFQQSEFERIVGLLGIDHLLQRYPITLSGGEKQRVAIGRALLTQPEMLLMDEPLSALDLPRKRELLNYLEKLSRQIQIPILYVTHSIDELLRLAERVVLLDDGKVKAYDDLERIWQNPLFTPWQTRQEKSAVLTLPILLQHEHYAMTALNLAERPLWVKLLDAPVGQPIRLCIQSSDVAISLTLPEHTSVRNILPVSVIGVETAREHADVKVRCGNYEFWAKISLWAQEELQLETGQSVYAQIKAVSIL
ncbi:molybdenum ABC transporter ATP-binding protein ModC [Pasteurellaceae bacterium LIM206]|nr:molybdenum ABC transporter ATP-binding protein ModC [Pasteurellaceae bacterium LIM206]